MFRAQTSIKARSGFDRSKGKAANLEDREFDAQVLGPDF